MTLGPIPNLQYRMSEESCTGSHRPVVKGNAPITGGPCSPGPKYGMQALIIAHCVVEEPLGGLIDEKMLEGPGPNAICVPVAPEPSWAVYNMAAILSDR